MKTILYLDHTAKISGGEIALLALLKALDRTRYMPVVVLASSGPLVQKLQQEGVETHVLSLPSSVVNTRKDSLGLSSLARVRQAWLCVCYAARLALWARQRRVDLIHTNSLKADLYGGLAARFAGIPVLWHVRDRIADGYLPGPVAAVFRLLAKTLPQAVVTNSEATMRCLNLPTSRPATVVHNGVAEGSFQSLRQKQMMVIHDGFDPAPFENAASFYTVPARPVVALVGRIAPWKGQHIFLEAAARVRTRYPDARFWIVGSPLFDEHAYEQTLHESADRLGLNSTVEFLGFQDDIPGILAQTDIVVHASTLGEPFGQVVIEGMAAGKPVVATDGGALPEIIKNGETGLLVPMSDSAQMAEAIEWLLSDPERAQVMGAAGQAHARSKFTSWHVARNIEAVYDAILARCGREPVSALPQINNSPVRLNSALRSEARADEMSLSASEAAAQ